MLRHLLTRRLDRLGVGPLGFVVTDYSFAIWAIKPMDGLDWDALFQPDMLGDDLDGATVRQAPAGSICPAGPAWQPGSHITTPSCRSAQTALLPTSPRLCPPAHLPALPLLPAWPVLALQVALALDAMDVHGFLEEHQFRDIVEAEQLNSKSQVATLWRHHLHNQRGGQRA